MSSKSDTLSMFRTGLLYIRYVLSTIVTIGCLCLIVYAISKGYAALDGHPAVLMLIFFSVVVLLAYLEGLQVAIMALVNVNRSYFRHMPRAYKNHQLALANHGLNVQRFLVGRQFFVVFVVFLAAQLTTYSELTIDWLPNFLYVLIIQTGMPGVLFVLSFGQLMPQLIASTHPVTVMDLPGSWSVIQMALFFESAGVTHFSWVLTIITKFAFKLNTPDIASWSREVSINKSKKSRKSSNKRSRVNPAFDSFITDCPLTVNNIIYDSLDYSSDKNNAIPSRADVQTMDSMKWLDHESVKNAFTMLGFDSKASESAWPKPEKIVRYLTKQGREVPVYLLPKTHEKYIAPYEVVMELMRKDKERNNAIH